jgi:hypothetical protein
MGRNRRQKRAEKHSETSDESKKREQEKSELVRRLVGTPMAQIKRSVLEEAARRGVDKRIGLLIAAAYHIHTIQSMLYGEASNLMEEFGLCIRDMKRAINGIMTADDTFYGVMRGMLKGETDSEFMHDVDSLFGKFMRWERLPMKWQPGDEQHLPQLSEEPQKEGTIVVEDGTESFRVGTVTMKGERTEKTKNPKYCVSRLNADETAEVVADNINGKGIACIKANRLAKSDPGNIYVIYEKREFEVEESIIRPIKAAAVTVGNEKVEIDIEDKEKTTA